MTGKRYYISTLDAWQRHTARFETSHYIALDTLGATNDHETAAIIANADSADFTPEAAPAQAAAGGKRILVLVEADEGVHLALEDDADYEVPSASSGAETDLQASTIGTRCARRRRRRDHIRHR